MTYLAPHPKSATFVLPTPISMSQTMWLNLQEENVAELTVCDLWDEVIKDIAVSSLLCLWGTATAVLQG